jgi:hypothetical protein
MNNFRELGKHETIYSGRNDVEGRKAYRNSVRAVVFFCEGSRGVNGLSFFIYWRGRATVKTTH